MTASRDTKPFPIPVVSSGFALPGMHTEDETLEYITMPQGMQTYRAPQLPEPEELAQHAGAVQLLHALVATVKQVVEGGAAQQQTALVSLQGLATDDVNLINQVLGEGEVSIQIMDAHGQPQVQIQESVFAGVWRVLQTLSDGGIHDSIEVGPVPNLVRQAAHDDGTQPTPAAPPLPSHMVNVPSLLVELENQRRVWQKGQSAHVVNLTLLPLTAQDIGYIDHRLGTGRILMLSRGYGNCRITNCCVPHTWRVVYYNSQDAVILNSIEVTDMPDVACAAPEDLADSLQRLQEVVQWVEQA